VLAETMSRYVKPLSMGQKIWVLTRTVACRKSSLKAYQVILSREPSEAEIEAAGDSLFSLGDVVFMLQIRFVFLDLKSMKSLEVPLSNRALLSIPDELFFEKNPGRRDVRLGEWPL
jgi:acyl-CoA thioesterase FadM